MASVVRRFIVTLATLALLAVPGVPAVASGDVEPVASLPRTPASVGSFTQALGFRIGHISIPAIGVNEIIREGIHMDVINRGVAHWAGTAQAGGQGNMVLAGHRTTFSRPFHDLDRLERGDRIFVTGLDGQVVLYRVSEILIVDPSAVWVVGITPTPTLTMFACHPKGSAAQRIVVRAEMESYPLALP